MLAALSTLHYDLAGSANATAIAALLTVVGASHVLYGSDWPFTPEPGVAGGLRWITSDENVVAPEQLTAAAVRLWPRLAGS